MKPKLTPLAIAAAAVIVAGTLLPAKPANAAGVTGSSIAASLTRTLTEVPAATNFVEVRDRGRRHDRWQRRWDRRHHRRHHRHYHRPSIHFQFNVPSTRYRYVEPRRYYRARLSPAHYRWCNARYRSYRPGDNTFQPYHGPRKQCVSPYF